jgi:archaellum component FlaF (FlaF/FlaG flagellin family)
MSDSTRIRTAVVVSVLVALVAVPLGTAAVAAQETTSTASTTAAEESSQDVVRQVDEDIRVVGYSYDEEAEEFDVELENRGDSSVEVTITEVITEERASGSGTFGIRVVEVEPGETVTSTVSVQSSGLNAVMILTPKSVESGSGTFVSVDGSSGFSLLGGEASWGLIMWAGLIGIVMTGIVVLIAAWHLVAQKSTDVEEVSVGS